MTSQPILDRTGPDDGSDRESPWPRRFQILGLLVLAPACAEYLAAYDDSTGDVAALVGNLVIFSPLYGAPALLIREVARRCRLGWLGIILLAAAFGLVEAGIIDQSLFSTDYRHIPSWDDYLRTSIGPLGFSAYNAMTFVGGHVIFSMCAPIALVEAFRPAHAREPWLSRWTIALLALLYAGACALVLGDSLMNEDSHASVAQIVGSVIVVALLVVSAFVLGRRVGDRSGAATKRQTPKARVVFLLALVAAALFDGLPTTWAGVAIMVSVLALGGVLLYRASHSSGWTLRHVVAVA